MPGEEPEAKHDVMFRYKEELKREKHLFRMENGTLSSVDVDPVILKEILYPDNPPNEKIVMLLEACFAAYNEGRIVFALKNLEEAKEVWSDTPGGVSSLDLVFFDFLKGSIYETACRDDLALQSYERAFKSSQK